MTHGESKKDIYREVTDEIIAAIEAGCGRWEMPWHVTGDARWRPANVASGRAYRGINLVCLWAAARRREFASGTWGTFRQWKERGARVRRGERATTIVFWKLDGDPKPREEEVDIEEDGATRRDPRRVFATGYAVFNADQVDGFEPGETPKLADEDRIAGAESFFRRIPADVRHGGDAAYYAPLEDYVAMPRFEDFKRPERYYAVLAHELTHWTGNAKRLGRDLSGRFGSRCYAAEELVAELGAAFLSCGLELALSARKDHAPYVAHWLELLRADKRAIFTAASRAQEAVDYLLTVHEAAIRDAA